LICIGDSWHNWSSWVNERLAWLGGCVKTKVKQSYIQISSSYRTVNTFRLGYKNQSVSVV
jgi:hypothetical protein